MLIIRYIRYTNISDKEMAVSGVKSKGYTPYSFSTATWQLNVLEKQEFTHSSINTVWYNNTYFSNNPIIGMVNVFDLLYNDLRSHIHTSSI